MPAGATVIFSAHGVSKQVRADAERRGLKVFDATCPLVTKVHVEVARMLRAGYEVVMIGHRGHPETEGTMGQAARGMHLIETVEDVAKLEIGTPDKVAYVTQTTLSIDDARAIVAALKARFPAIRGPKKDDICYATQNRQDAVKWMAPRCEVVIVVGRRTARTRTGCARWPRTWARRPTWWIARRTCRNIAGKRRVGVTAGASAPRCWSTS